jgi:hypothetical protein
VPNDEIWESFLVAVKQSFNDDPYHNWRHAFDSLQAAFVFLVRHCDGMELAPLEQLGLLIVASLCQDLGHPGCNNDFMVKTESKVAALYNHGLFWKTATLSCLDKRRDLNVWPVYQRKIICMKKIIRNAFSQRIQGPDSLC